MGLFSKNETVVLKVEGMTCQHCSKAVETSLMGLSDVKKVKIDLPTGTVTVTLKKSIDNSVLIKAVENAGYDASI